MFRLFICCLSSAVYKHFTLITPYVSIVLLFQEPNRLTILISFIFVTVQTRGWGHDYMSSIVQKTGYQASKGDETT